MTSAGIVHEVVATCIDDGELTPGRVSASHWAAALAYLKARAGADRADCAVRGWVLGADTVCVLDGRIIGQPRSRDHAGEIIRSFAGRAHEVVTGVALVNADSGDRRIFADVSVVSLGVLSDEAIDSYLDSGLWRGKAGAYNLAERAAAGWPLRCDGDPTSVMGLPMARLVPMLMAHGLAHEPNTERACCCS